MTTTNPPGGRAHTHENGLKQTVPIKRSQLDGPEPTYPDYFKGMVKTHFAVRSGTVIWIEAPHPRAKHLVGLPAGYQAVSKLQGRSYQGNTFINFLGQRYLAQDIAWVVHYDELVPHDKRLIHLDGDRANNKKTNLHLQMKPGFFIGGS